MWNKLILIVLSLSETKTVSYKYQQKKIKKIEKQKKKRVYPFPQNIDASIIFWQRLKSRDIFWRKNNRNICAPVVALCLRNIMLQNAENAKFKEEERLTNRNVIIL